MPSSASARAPPLEIERRCRRRAPRRSGRGGATRASGRRRPGHVVESTCPTITAGPRSPGSRPGSNQPVRAKLRGVSIVRSGASPSGTTRAETPMAGMRSRLGRAASRSTTSTGRRSAGAALWRSAAKARSGSGRPGGGSSEPPSPDSTMPARTRTVPTTSRKTSAAGVSRRRWLHSFRAERPVVTTRGRAGAASGRPPQARARGPRSRAAERRASRRPQCRPRRPRSRPAGSCRCRRRR